MAEILPLGKKEMYELGLSFVSLTVPAFSSLSKSYLMNVYWFLDLEMVKEQCSTIDPLIIFDLSSVYEGKDMNTDESRLPKEIIESGKGYVMRAVVDINEREWNQVIDNVFHPKDIKYTFEWDFQYYKNEKVRKLIEKQNIEEERNRII